MSEEDKQQEDGVLNQVPMCYSGPMIFSLDQEFFQRRVTESEMMRHSANERKKNNSILINMKDTSLHMQAIFE